ncbi:MAG: MBOAT family protein [Lachnospiraceae bacterium]|nr:MBOAT family protein [Lachnospiraceae bacterium]
MLISKWLIVWAFLAIIIAYTSARVIEYKRETTNKYKTLKCIMLVGICSLIAILAGLKYTNFAFELINSITDTGLSFESIAVPIGISFYTLQAVGYVLDVYWERIDAEHNILRLSLFILFFPTLMEGPICRYSDTKDQLFEGKPITARSLRQGAIRIGWGLFKRMIIADRLNALINYFYLTDPHYEGMIVIICAILTTLQLYAEFAGTIDIVIGSALIFNIKLPENFRQPFMAKSAAEFWRRWHITLGVWLKSYVFYPVTTSRLVKKWNKFARKRIGKHFTKVVTSTIALFPVWLINGLWHGPKVTYIAYGMYYFIILVLEIAFEPAGKAFWKKVHLREDGFIVKAVRLFRTWIIIVIGEMLFRAESISQFIKLCANIFTSNFDGGLMKGKLVDMGLSVEDLFVALFGIVIMFVVDAIVEKRPDFFETIPTLSRTKRWLIYYFVIIMIVIFGAYGEAYKTVELIYANF